MPNLKQLKYVIGERFPKTILTSKQDAQAAMTKYNAVEKFTISSKPVLVDYIHAGVFVPLIGPRDGHTERFSFSASANPSLRLKYWDDGAYVSELGLSVKNDTTIAADSKGNSNTVQNVDPNNEGLVAVDEGSSGKAKKRKGDANAGASTKKVCTVFHLL